LHERDVAAEVGGEGEGRCPHQAANDVVDDELAVGHGADPGDERGEGTDDRDETGEEDGLATVLGVERLRPLQVLPLQETDVVVDGARADAVADPVVDRVAQDGGESQKAEQHPGVERPGGGESALREQQRVAGQEGHEEHARLDEDDGERPGSGALRSATEPPRLQPGVGRHKGVQRGYQRSHQEGKPNRV
jgi:hypothetical protein